jgi:hypothetical protein
MDFEDIKVFRFELSSNIKEEIIRFSSLNELSDRETFKENWKIWILDNKEFIENEVDKLEIKKYNGDILKKMYISARYYYRNKKKTSEPVKRKKYVSLSKDLLISMDNHIKESIKGNNYKPEKSFEEFCIDPKNHPLLKGGIIEIKDKDKNITLEDIKKKIKKTYKNRYRLIIT